MRPLAIFCLTLATAVATIQTTPQRIEREQAWRWCVYERHAEIEKLTTFIVDGRRTQTTAESLLTIRESALTFMEVFP